MDLEAELRKSATEEELELWISEKVGSFHGLLTREVAVRLIAKERGLLRSEDKAYRLSDIPKGERKVSFEAKVRKVWPVAQYPSGKRSRVVEVEDDTGSRPLVLWNDDIALAKTLRAKDAVRVKGSYEKNGELHLGYSGSLDIVSKAAFTDLHELADGHGIHLRGFVSSIEGEDTFVREGRSFRGFSFMLSDGKCERRCVLLSLLGRASHIESGDEIILENADARDGDIEITDDTRMLSRRAKDMLIGELGEIVIEAGAGGGAEGEMLRVAVGEKAAVFGREDALRFLGVEAADDIALSTVVQLKKDAMIDKRIAVRLVYKDGHVHVR
jgi:hypothetical protein